MMKKQELSDLLELEKTLNLYEEEYHSFPLWRLFRYKYRRRYLNDIQGFENDSRGREFRKKMKYISIKCWNSFVDLFRLLLSRKSCDNVIFAYPRLQKPEGVYIDKFTDPVIDHSSLINSTLVFQKSYRVFYENCRYNDDKIIRFEFESCIGNLGALFYFLYHFFSNDFRKLNSLYKKMKIDFRLSKKDLFYFHFYFCQFVVQVWFSSLIFRKLKVKRLFVVVREVFLPQLCAAHKLSIPTYEFQHGVTMGDTIMYSGPYDPMIDPDYFLSFGSLWKGSQFGIPIGNIINIGWAYKNVVNGISSKESYGDDTVLVISSPEISEKIVETCISLANRYKDYCFHIRCHPQETLSKQQVNRVLEVSNLLIADKEVDSFVALKSYKYVLGTNSSVLYEALSLGKTVGRVCYNNFKIIRLEEGIEDDGFFYLKNEYDFINFVRVRNETLTNTAYSDFKPEIVDKLPMKG